MPPHPIPVTVVTGFLGAGKTTLVNRWLAEAERGEIAVIVNELGDVGIDGALLSARALELVEITGGCVCCATQADLVRALGRIATATTPPKRIVIETSGAASPSGVVHAVGGSARIGAHVLDGIVTIVDASRLSVLDEHDLAVEQVGYADVVVLSHADRCDATSLANATHAIATINGAAIVVPSGDARSERERLDALLGRRHEVPPAPHAHAAAPHRVYESISLAIAGEVDEERFADFMENELARFAGRLFRVKGIIAVHGLDARMIVQGVADLVEVTFGDAWRGDEPRSSRLVLVGFGLDRDALTRAFEACVSRPG